MFDVEPTPQMRDWIRDFDRRHGPAQADENGFLYYVDGATRGGIDGREPPEDAWQRARNVAEFYRLRAVSLQRTFQDSRTELEQQAGQVATLPPSDEAIAGLRQLRDAVREANADAQRAAEERDALAPKERSGEGDRRVKKALTDANQRALRTIKGIQV